MTATDVLLKNNAAYASSFADIKQSVDRIKASPFVLNTDEIRGFVYEVETGRLREVS